MVANAESASTRSTRLGAPRVSIRSASWESSRLSAASGSPVKRQTTPVIPGRSAAARVESAATDRNSPRRQPVTRYAPLPTSRAIAVSAAHASRGMALQTWRGITRTWLVASKSCSGDSAAKRTTTVIESSAAAVTRPSR